jgi:hypothetical protein
MRTRLLPFFSLGSLFLVGCGATGNPSGSGTGTGGSSSGNGGAATTSAGTGGAGGTISTGTGTGGASTTTTTGGASTTTTTGGTGGSGGMGCAVGKGDCNGNPADGCEADLYGDTKNCGACANICPGGGGTPASCTAGMCGLACAAGTGDCDMNAANGCETNLKTDAQNCGACGMNCGGGPCVQGACACAAESKTANPVPLDLFIMLDESGSMSEAVAGGGTKWSAVTTALKGFINDPTNAGLGVGIQYFPLAPPVCSPFCASNADCGNYGPCAGFFCVGCLVAGGDSCVINDYATPAVEIAALNAVQAGKLVTSINMNGPTNNTPTAPALSGAIKHAKAWATAHPSHDVVVVLASDGIPTECDPTDIPSIAGIAAAGVNGNPSIKTFVIGVGDSVADLNALAVGGGTGSAFFVDTNANVVQQFEAALNAIQQSALGCEYTIPAPQMGMLDYNKVNVQYTPGNGAPQLIANVANAAACDPNTGGWYYDNNAAPTKIILCAKTCTPVQADPQGKIDILLGCATQHM